MLAKAKFSYVTSNSFRESKILDSQSLLFSFIMTIYTNQIQKLWTDIKQLWVCLGSVVDEFQPVSFELVLNDPLTS